jgi:SAM-dependent methyltransferase
VCRDYLGAGSTDVWTLWRCRDCASLFLDPRPDDDSIPLTYQGYYTHRPPTATATGSFLSRILWRVINDYLTQKFGMENLSRYRGGRWLCGLLLPLRFKLDYYGRHLFVRDFPNKGTLLDVGCGNGEFLLLARQMGWRALGVEPDLQAAKACQEQGLTVFAGMIDSVPAALNATIDVVTLSHCAEHVVDLRDLLTHAHRLLRPNGRIWLALPNPEGPGIKVFGKAWRGLEPSRHLCIPSQRQLQTILGECGFADARAVRRGAHGKTITKESARIARLDPSTPTRFIAWMAVPVRLLASLAGTISARWGEETVMTARKRSAC